eukprot:203363-Amphidinium_carterae.2
MRCPGLFSKACFEDLLECETLGHNTRIKARNLRLQDSNRCVHLGQAHVSSGDFPHSWHVNAPEAATTSSPKSATSIASKESTKQDGLRSTGKCNNGDAALEFLRRGGGCQS